MTLHPEAPGDDAERGGVPESGVPGAGSFGFVPDAGSLSLEPDAGPEYWDPVAEAGIWDAELAGWVPPVPDDVGLVTEVAGMMSIFAAQRLERVDMLRCNALADPASYGGGTRELVERSVRLELAAALRITEAAAGALLGWAEAMVHRYPAALVSLGRAGMTERHAQVLARLLDGASAPVRERLTGRAVELAEELPVGSFQRQLRRLIETEEAATLTARHEDALRERRVVIEPAHDGMAWLHALLPAVEAHAIHARITAIAKTITGRGAAGTGEGHFGGGAGAGKTAEGGDAGTRTSDGSGAFTRDDADTVADTRTADEANTVDADVRTLDQTRADVLGDLLIDGNTDTHPAEARGIRATVAVTVPALALLATDDADRHDRGLPPATVEGIGPIPLSTAKDLCGGEESWMRVLTHPETGIVLSVGRTRYRPPPALRTLIRWRADRCMAPGCGIPASRCEIDHTIDWQHGGHTALHNHAPLCTGHHTVKHHGGWTVTQIPDSGGALLWTSPTGRTYHVTPERPTPHFHPTPDTHSGTSDAPF
jgi:hypothetical protein